MMPVAAVGFVFTSMATVSLSGDRLISRTAAEL
eukprot:SAG11_NODE_30890_length_296_cov_1.573604_1_plen_32_part_10